MRLEEIVAANVEGLRRAQGLGYEQLARKARLSLSHAYMVARGLRSPALDTLERLAGALGTTVPYLVQRHARPGRESAAPPARSFNRGRPPRASAGRAPG